MNRQIFAWEIPHYRLKSREYWWECLYFFLLLLAALVLFCHNLGSLPLRDWDEGTFAQVAREIYESSFSHWQWLFPTLWQQPYLNKPPLIHTLTAIAYSFLGVSEFSSRIVGASLTALSVPLLYLMVRELFIPRYYALFSALVYLTTLPVVRHGRLAMLDGAVLCFEVLLFLCLLKTRRDLRWSYGVGISLSLLCLTEGWMVAILLGGIGLLYITWDTPRLATSFYFWGGVILGILPSVSWYSAQYLYYGEQYIRTAIQHQSLNRIFRVVEGNSGAVWYYLLELAKYYHPWLFLSLWGIRQAWEYRNWSWGRLILSTIIPFLVAISLMQTKLPWYILPIYPFLAITTAVALAETKNLPSSQPYPPLWSQFFFTLTLATVGGMIYFLLTQPEGKHILVNLILLSITFLSVAILLQRRDEQFIAVLFWGMFISLLVFISSAYWLWELNEAFAVKPVAELIRKNVPVDKRLYINFEYERPSLNFYSQRHIPTFEWEEVSQIINQKTYLLIPKKRLDELQSSRQLSPRQCHKINGFCFEAIGDDESEFVLLKPQEEKNEQQTEFN